MVRDLRLRAREIGDQEWLNREEQKRSGWQWENALRRHNFVGFTGEVLKGVVRSKLQGHEELYSDWVEEAKAKTRSRLQQKGLAERAVEKAEL